MMKIVRDEFRKMREYKKALNATETSLIDVSEFGLTPEEWATICKNWRFVGLNNWHLVEALEYDMEETKKFFLADDDAWEKLEKINKIAEEAK